ncbi:GIY-YIG nuclease family protein, partial [Candidatus Woesearchaeota archaeon]|nr:GIY-YIG nuclease family protein [Candidatus Woesearchaeota archaeon]
MIKSFFPSRPKTNPTIYAYKIPNTPNRKDLLKIGYTNRSAQERVKEQLQTTGLPYEIVLIEPAIRNDGTSFSDHEIHRYLKSKGYSNPDGEWFKCTVSQVRTAIHAVKTGQLNIENRSQFFLMRPEQEDAVNKTIQYFKSFKDEPENKSKTPRFLWNAKMRFGKTFASYQLAKKQGWKKILVLTFKPAVQSAWGEDLMTHVDFEGWQFITTKNDEHLNFEDAD